MKKLAVIALVGLLPFAGAGQNRVLDNFLEHYGQNDQVARISVSGAVFDLMADIAASDDDPDSQALGRISRGLKKMEVIVLPYRYTGIGEQELTRLFDDLGQMGYEEYVNVRQQGEKVQVLALEGNEQISDMLVLVSNKKELVILALKGSISHSDLAYLARHHNNFH